MRGRAGLISAVGCLLSLAATIADAGVLATRLRWWPSASPEVVGYRVYLRPAGGAYGAGAKVLTLDESSIRNIPGARVIRRGDFVAIVAEREWDAVRAAQQLKTSPARYAP